MTDDERARNGFVGTARTCTCSCVLRERKETGHSRAVRCVRRRWPAQRKRPRWPVHPVPALRQPRRRRHSSAASASRRSVTPPRRRTRPWRCRRLPERFALNCPGCARGHAAAAVCCLPRGRGRCRQRHRHLHQVPLERAPRSVRCPAWTARGPPGPEISPRFRASF